MRSLVQIFMVGIHSGMQLSFVNSEILEVRHYRRLSLVMHGRSSPSFTSLLPKLLKGKREVAKYSSHISDIICTRKSGNNDIRRDKKNTNVSNKFYTFSQQLLAIRILVSKVYQTIINLSCSQYDSVIGTVNFSWKYPARISTEENRDVTMIIPPELFWNSE